ncbi:CoA transferase [Peribacillus simplex]|uniref:CaiB/BaiF CoA transferase family protein n=1 Tax=Peribacillus TaxID=2675229 RepID=UPI0019217F92|nr:MULTISPECIES: CaiB/BaiF CoA-transferase family protein [Peribacillus]MBD8591181.1 CoA transferase [Peribacillus simplex]MCP1096121.1 CoA transferase [Bacillaceae bacterium OS4b]MCT1390608.1 CoA transferase [Peribacillus frigoritolerans]
MTKALSRIKVLDLSRVVAGPVCTSILGDLGADIIKVEGPDFLDETRAWFPPDIEDISLYYMAVNRNKRAITVNLKTKEGIQIIKKLIQESDVIVENFKTGTMERLGLGYEDLKALNPKIIHCSITGFGHTGPYKQLPGYDFLAQAMSGFMSVNGTSNGEPVKAGIAMADLYAGLYAIISILAALEARKHTGRGQHCDISLMDSMVASLLNIGTGFLNTGNLPKRYGNQHPTLVPYQNFQTKDKEIIIAVGNDRQFQRFCSLINTEELPQDERFATANARIIYREELIPKLQEVILTKTADEWLTLFQENNIPCGPINTLDRVFTDEQVLERQMIQEVEHPTVGIVKLLGSPIKLSDTPVTIERHPPLHGEHTEEVLLELGYDKQEIESFMEDKVI